MAMLTPATLMSICSAVIPCRVPGNFEIHVAVMIFGAGDVREDGVFIAFDDQAHRDAGAGGLERHARVHQSERTAADRGHRRRSVRFENVRNAAHGVGEIRVRRHQVRKSAFGEGAVTDFAAAGPAQEFHFADGERREVVMQHEVLEGIFLEEKILALHVFLGAERGGGKRLRFTASEKRGAVSAGQNARLASDFADLVESACIRTALAREHIVAEDEFAQALESAGGELFLLEVFRRQRRVDFGLDGVYAAVAFGLRILGGVRSVAQFLAVLLLHLLVERFIERRRREGNLRHVHLGLQFANGGNDLADFRVREFQRVGDGIFGNFQRARFHHDDGLIGAGHHEIHGAGLLFGDGGIHDELAFEHADAHGGDRRGEWNFRDVQRGGSGGDADHVRIIFAVRGEHHGNDLRLVGPAFGKQRPQRAVNQPRGQNFLFRGAAFALEESAGNFSRGVGVLAVVHGKRQKIFFGRFAVHAGGGQNHGVAITRHHGAVRLTGHLARLEAEGASANFQTNFFKHHFTSFLPRFTGDAWFRYEISVSGNTAKGESREENGAGNFATSDNAPRGPHVA